MKVLLSPIGLIIIVAIVVILFWPRRTPDHIKKRIGKPMRAFPDEQAIHTRAGQTDSGSRADGNSEGDSAGKDG